MSEHLGKVLLVAGGLIALAGGILYVAGRTGIGRLPGDLLWRGENWTVYVPLGWMIVLSVVLTILLNLFAGDGGGD